MMKTAYRGLTVAALLLLMCGATGCKPTEKNYKSAYEAAKLKKERAADALHEDVGDGIQLIDLDGPREIKVGNVNIFVVNNPVKYFCGAKDEIRQWNVAVAVYSMPTNCTSQVEALSKNGLKAFGVVTTGNKYYVVAASFDTLEEAEKFASDYSAKNKPEVFVGLDGHPVLLER